MKKWFFVVSLILVLMASSLVGCNNPESGTESITVVSQQEGISVNGQGKVSVTPDIAILTVGVQSQEASVASAQVKATDAMNKVVSALTGNGIASKDIQTKRFSIQVVTRYDTTTQQEVIIGYSVTNTVTAKIRTLDKVGVIIDAATSAGGDLTRIEGINFSVEDPTTYYSQAREKAIADAKAKAEQMARLIGVTMGEPTFISESTSSPIYQDSRIALPVASETPISLGELEVSASVQVVYAISK